MSEETEAEAETETDQVAAEGEDGSEEQGEGKKKRFTKKKLIMMMGLLLVLGGAGTGGAWFMGYFDPPPQVAADGEEPVVVIDPPVFHEMPEMTVNLAGSEGRAQFLRLEIALEVKDDETLDLIKPVLPRVTDTFQTYLRELRKADLEGSAGIYRLREELLRRINLAVYPASVDDVLFKQLLVQ